MKQDLHTHTLYCDGNNTVEEMIKSAIENGLSRIGFSGHSYTVFDTRYCMSLEGTEKYIAEINEMKEKYRGEIDILCGIEQDFCSGRVPEGFDYAIGSVHYIPVGKAYVPVDEEPELLLEGANKHFNGDIYALCEAYFDCVSRVIKETNADIIGHFDLITKFNEKEFLFDEKHPRYVNARNKAVLELLKENKPFEINTGAISRGYKSFPYPDEEVLKIIAENSGHVIFSGDSHSVNTLCYNFDEFEFLIRKYNLTLANI